MGDLINLRRARKAAQRAAKAEAATSNRVTHGTPKHLRKAAQAEKKRAREKIEAQKLDSGKPES